MAEELTSTKTAPTAVASCAPRLCIVVPCYNEEEVLPETCRRLGTKLKSLIERGAVAPTSRVFFVNDGSRDRTWELICVASAQDTLFAGICFAHNEGHQNALYAGLMRAHEQGFDCAVSLDADLQDDVDAIDQMLVEHANGAEIVFGVRNNRDTDTAFKRNTAHAFYGFMRWLGVEMVSDSADYRLMGRRALEALSQYREVNLFLRGIVPALGFKTAKVYYKRGERFAGESKYPLGKMISFALEGITSFSVKPIRWVTMLGALSLLVSLAMIVYTLLSIARGNVVSGWSSLMVSIWFVGGLIMVSLGIVGEYVGRIYLEAKGRPRYVIAAEVGADEDGLRA